MNIATESSRRLPIERIRAPAPQAFQESYLAGYGKPAIITDALSAWAAPSVWNFDLFKSRYGSDNVAPRTRSAPNCAKLMKLGHYLDYLDAPERPSPGFWIDLATNFPCPAPAESIASPLYLAWNVFGLHPELLEDVQLSPAFTEDWRPLLPEGLRKALDLTPRYNSAGIMIGPKNSQLGLHYDVLDTHACLTQIVGSKRCVLFSPEDSPALYNGKVNVDAPDFEQFPLFRRATGFECVLEPGEVLFMPHGWWHHVVALEKTITLSYNFFNRINFDGFLTNILQSLPALVKSFDNLPDVRATLGIDWTCRGFDFPKSSKA